MKSQVLIFNVLLVLLIWSPDAHAYLDPGSGSFLLQILIASLLGVTFAIKTFWRNIKSFVSRSFSKDKQPRHDAE